ncbi:alpha/beta fold hydrolase [Roseivivax isoporae]|nr:alpha/beta hydrolase [Roseivivax isoporae]
MHDAAPFLSELSEGPEGTHAFWVEAIDAVRLRLAHFPAKSARGTVLLFPGRTEYVEKYGRTARDLAERGYATLCVDWRGQGLADRFLADVRTGHVASFADYQKDVDAMIAAARSMDLPRPFHLLAHSMGGCIGLRALMRGIDVASVVFTGPMWGIQMASTLRPAAWALSWSGARLGLGHVYTPGTRPDAYVVAEAFENNLLTTDTEMYEYMRSHVMAEPRLQLGGPSLHWLHQALGECRDLAQRPSPSLPCVTFVGSNERIVDVLRIRERMARWPGGRLEVIAGGEHEVLMEGREIRTRIVDAGVALFDAAADGGATRSATA